MTGGMHYTPTHTNVCKFLNFQLTFSPLILRLKCWNFARLLKYRVFFLVLVYVFKGTQSRFCACARVWFLNRRLTIQRGGNWYRAFTNPFASSSINFGFALKLLRIKDQWYKVLVKCQFVCNRDLSVLTSEGSVMALDEDGFLLAAFRKV